MLYLIFFVTFFATSLSIQNYSREAIQKNHPGFGTDWIPIGQRDDGEFIIGYFSKNIDNGRFSFSAEPSEVVTFTLYTRQNPEGTQLKGSSIKSIEKILDKNKPIKCVTHGWMSSGNADSSIDIKNGFLEKYDANVFIMDWSEISGNVLYPIPMAATKSVGDYYGEFLNEIVDYGIDPKNIHLVGHSLGAHVSGFAARRVKSGKIKRVTGLDPASPGFDGISMVEGGRLDKSDAEFVDIIHTCGGYLGMKTSIGHADFHPNGGSVPQPGCDNVFEMMEACSHGRSWAYFAESLISPVPFIAYRCDSVENLHKDQCKTEGIPMGDSVPLSAKGDYYLRTDTASPYAIKDVRSGFDNFIDSNNKEKM